VIDGAGAGHLETITLRERGSAGTEVVPASALFLLIGAEPRTAWLKDSVAREGDVRHRSIKRVAAAVGEGSTAVQLVHEYLSDPADPATG